MMVSTGLILVGVSIGLTLGEKILANEFVVEVEPLPEDPQPEQAVEPEAGRTYSRSGDPLPKNGPGSPKPPFELPEHRAGDPPDLYRVGAKVIPAEVLSLAASVLKHPYGTIVLKRDRQGSNWALLVESHGGQSKGVSVLFKAA